MENSYIQFPIGSRLEEKVSLLDTPWGEMICYRREHMWQSVKDFKSSFLTDKIQPRLLVSLRTRKHLFQIDDQVYASWTCLHGFLRYDRGLITERWNKGLADTGTFYCLLLISLNRYSWPGQCLMTDHTELTAYPATVVYSLFAEPFSVIMECPQT